MRTGQCGAIALKNVEMSKAHNERMTLEQQIQPLVTKDIRAFFPAMVVRIGLSAVSASALRSYGGQAPFRTFVTFRHYARGVGGAQAAPVPTK
jgi:hypothetical protein